MKLFAIFLISFWFVGSVFGQQTGRIESEFKIGIPSEEEETLWSFLIQNYGPESIEKLDASFTSSISEEKFIDVYFDTDDLILKKK